MLKSLTCQILFQICEKERMNLGTEGFYLSTMACLKPVSIPLLKSASGTGFALWYQKWFLNAFRAAHTIFESISLHSCKSFKSWRSQTGAEVLLEQLNYHLACTKEMNLTKCLICDICPLLLSKTVPARNSSVA